MGNATIATYKDRLDATLISESIQSSQKSLSGEMQAAPLLQGWTEISRTTKMAEMNSPLNIRTYITIVKFR